MNFKVNTEAEKENYAQFIIEPLEAGFGHTVGNSLRRVLLTALEGAAVTTIKIDGVSHQFSTISGVSEDVIEIILNIKKLRIKLYSEGPVKLLLNVSGKKEVKGKDIEVMGGGEIVNPEQYIASLTDAKSKLRVEMEAQKGKGYSLADERKNNEIGTIAVDALYSPVINVNYSVESTRVGRKADFDKLTIEVTTDGTLTPKEALDEAANLLSDAFRQIYKPVVEEQEEQVSAPAISKEVLESSIEELDLPVRINNALRAIDIDTIENLINMPKPQLLKAKNLGNKSLSMISEKLSERGLSLREA